MRFSSPPHFLDFHSFFLVHRQTSRRGVGTGEPLGVRRRGGGPGERGRRRRRRGVGRGAQGRDQTVAGAAGGAGDGERVHERQAEPAAVGGGAPVGRNRDADLRRLVGRVERRGQRAQPRVLHLNEH